MMALTLEVMLILLFCMTAMMVFMVMIMNVIKTKSDTKYAIWTIRTMKGPRLLRKTLAELIGKKLTIS